jgi:endonuclease/exonuclease/phosphatase family metal-dependent hydrolase
LSFFPYKFNAREVVSGSSFGVMNFNVRLFNKYEWITSDKIPDEISDFIKKEAPEIVTLQEYANNNDFSISYPYQYKKLNRGKKGTGLAIFSKFRIVNQGSLDFENSNNNAIFIDILRSDDTIRVYNVHLESFGIKPDSVDLNLDETRSRKLIYRLKNSFTKQQDQVEKFLEHRKTCHYKTIISGDFNNTAFSWAYRKLKGDLNDSFIEAGQGFGKTYPFNNYPLRIDFILSDKKFKVNQHKNFEIKLSDHEPVMARFSY